jgi:hypothetical protein
VKLDPAKQLDYAKDTINQVITLSSAILAVSLTFSQNWASKASDQDKQILQWSWLALIVAVTFGIWAMAAVAGIAYLGRGDLSRWSLRLPWLLQIAAFFSGLCLLTWFGVRVL